MALYVNPAMLQWAREESGLTIEAAAKKIGVPPARLIRWEEGSELPTIPQLRKMASVYHRPTAIFYLNSPPPRLEMPDFRRLKSPVDFPPSPELILEIRKIHQRREAAIMLAEFGPQYSWDFVGSIKDMSDPERHAEDIRSLLGIENGFLKGVRNDYDSFNRWRSAVESLGILVFLLRGVPVEEMRGLAIGKKPYPVIAVNRKDSPRARTFTLIHELCHVMMGESTICDIEEDGNQFNPNAKEVFCNHVAGAVLVPRTALLESPTVRKHERGRERWTDAELGKLGSEFHVSKEVILRRLLILGRTTHEFYGWMAEQWRARPTEAKSGGRETVPERVVRVVGPRFVDLLMTAHSEGAITLDDISELLDMKLKHLDAVEVLLMKGA